jgi:hypothetical protein
VADLEEALDPPDRRRATDGLNRGDVPIACRSACTRSAYLFTFAQFVARPGCELGGRRIALEVPAHGFPCGSLTECVPPVAVDGKWLERGLRRPR